MGLPSSDPSGSALVYSTYIGGSSFDNGYDIAVDLGGNAYVAGSTSSPDFPTTPGAFQPALAGDRDAFVAKFNAAGTALVYSSYLGGAGDDSASGIAVDSARNAYVTGVTASTDFPTTPGAFDPVGTDNANAFVTKTSDVESP